MKYQGGPKWKSPKARGTLPAGLSGTDMAFQIARHPEHETGETPHGRTRRGTYSDGLDLFVIPAWHRRAECAKPENASLAFLPHTQGRRGTNDLERVIACCDRCVVRRDCLNEALRLEADDRDACYGIRAGLTADQRRVLIAQQEQGVVYFGVCTGGPRSGLIKIGTSRTRLDQRLKKNRLELLATEPGSYSREHDLHLKFRRHRVVGEWFRPAGQIIAYIGSLPDRRFDARGVA